MNAGQRVDAVRRLTAVMQDRSYSEIDLVFKQFGVPWSDNWDGDAKSYLMHYLGEAKDETLTALEAYFGSDDAEADSPAPGVWAGDLFRLFFSHSSVDKVLVSDLKKALRAFGIEGFVAHEDIDPTAEWLQTILGALDSCDALLAVLTEDFRTSLWCEQEVGYCIGMRKLVIPAARGVMPHGFMGRYQALKCQDADAHAVAKAVYQILVQHPLSSARMAEALVANLERSDSFAEAKGNMALVRQIKVWTPDLLRTLEGTTKNYQVSHSFGVPESIRAVVAANTSPEPDDGEDIPF